jgi:undecaprenyl-diphosphatase
VTDALLTLLEQYGLPIVLVAALLENVFLVGMFVPGQAIVFAAGVATRFAELGVVGVAAMAVVGETAGNIVSYWMGRLGGRPWLQKRRSRRGGSRIPLDDAEAFFEKHGVWALLLGRPAWGLKNVLPAVAGMTGMPFWKAAALVALSSLVYYPALVGVAYAVGLSVEQASNVAAWLGVALTLVLAGIAFGLWRRFRSGE